MNSTKRRGSWKRREEQMDESTVATHNHDDHRRSERKDGEETKSRGKSYRLLTFDEVPDYMKDNEFIRKYYRGEWPLKHLLLSLFRWHNETLNIWTHLMGFALFLGLVAVNLVHAHQVVDLFGIFRYFTNGTETNLSYNSGEIEETMKLHGAVKQHHLNHLGYNSMPVEIAAAQWPFYTFMGGAILCLLSSTTYHLFSCHSHHLSLLLSRADYAGIAVMIVASFFPPIYYIFQCQPHWQIAYLSVITLIGIFTVAALLSPPLSSGKYRVFRTLLFSSMGLFGLIPAVHATVVNWDNPRRNTIVAYELFMAFFYLVGAGFYASRVPERFKPGFFDVAGQSHQIFHVLVVLGALAHYGAVLVLLDYRDVVGCDTTLG
ncbi:hypothetical protein Nepgr_020820 [Nepenthes gracilis]|uniref:Heptahelical transmembrane protein 1 n=1 Tax=Nepenthes gracilis TaxID=150966 RepID=A0AAD3SYE7_NEPGR|nr:hypothetical protein Nepgr_020820 [Nepenthes gracilis]